jgi:CHAD domain-containing protein
MKKALPKSVQLEFKARLADLAKETNLLRDLDVFLLDQARYRNMLPPNYRIGLDSLFRIISVERKKTQQKVA